MIDDKKIFEQIKKCLKEYSIQDIESIEIIDTISLSWGTFSKVMVKIADIDRKDDNCTGFDWFPYSL